MACGNGRGRIKNEEMPLDLRDIYDVIRKRIWLIVAVTLTATILSGILSFFVIKPTYEASTSVIIGKMPNTEAFIKKAMVQFSSGTVKIMDPSVVPEHPSKLNKILNVTITFFLGLMVSAGIVFLIEYMDNTIKTENDVGKYIGLPVIGMIPINIEESRRG